MQFPFLVTVPEWEIEDVDSFMKELELSTETIYCGVVSEGEPAGYALMWEFGNVRQTQPGPKTTLGITPDGKRVWLSIQAPFGYIRVNEGRYWEIVREEMKNVSLTGPDANAVRLQLEIAAFRICNRVAEIIQDTVPVDTGALRASIVPLRPNDVAALPGFEEMANGEDLPYSQEGLFLL